MKQKISTSLVIPAYNEEKAIKKVIEEGEEYVDEIIVVDDGSKDRTFDIVLHMIAENKKKKKSNLKLVKLWRNCGKATALKKGVEHATKEVIIFTDADDTYPARHIPELVREIQKGHDLVIGSRFLPKAPENMSCSHKFANKVLSGLVSYISSADLTDSQSGLRAFRKEIFSQIDIKAKSLEYEPKTTARAAKLGYKIKEIPIDYRERLGESKNKGCRDGIKILISLAGVVYTETTLLARTILMPSIFLGIFGIVLAIYLALQFLMLGIIRHPYFPLIAALSLLLSTQLFSLGLIIDNITKKLIRIEETMRRKLG